MAKKKPEPKKSVETIEHQGEKRTHIPTAEYQSLMREDRTPKTIKYPRNTDLDPQLVWRGKDEQDWSDLVVHAPPIYIQEKVHPKVLIDDLLRESQQAEAKDHKEYQYNLFAQFNGLPEKADKTDFYQHEGHWTNRMILGDSLQVMASLAEREGLRGKVQCIYFDPPYGIKFNSNFQWSSTSRDVKDGNRDHITREPEQVKAFRDTWRDGIHSYLSYIRDRLTIARDLLTESGSIFVQIGDENVHRVRAVMDEVFGDENFCSQISFRTTGGQSNSLIASSFDLLLWYAKSRQNVKYRPAYLEKPQGAEGSGQYVLLEKADGSEPPFTMSSVQKYGEESLPDGFRVLAHDTLYSSGAPSDPKEQEYRYCGQLVRCPENNHWKPGGRGPGMVRLDRANRFLLLGKTLRYKRYWRDFAARDIENTWTDTARSGFADKKRYVVETSPRVVERCLLVTTDPGDLVLDPTCGSGTTAYVAEQWGRRWITIDTSRVALALARARIMGARYPFYLLADSPEGQKKEAEITAKPISSQPTHGKIRQGFVYERMPHITLKSIANNAEIDVIWQKYEDQLLPLRDKLTACAGQDQQDEQEKSNKQKTKKHQPINHPVNPVHPVKTSVSKCLAEFRKTQKYTVELPVVIQEWEVPRELPEAWPESARPLHEEFWKLRIARQKAIDASIAAKAEFEYLYDKPYEDKKKVRVAGPFTVESLSPHRMLGVDENDELIDPLKKVSAESQSFEQMILENLRSAGVQQAHKEDRITFTSLTPWPGKYICAEGLYREGEEQRRAGILIGPEFGTVQRQDLVLAAREAGDAGFDVLISCAFNYEAHTTDFANLGRIRVLKARMNADLHMSNDLKNTGKGNLFVIFGEPDIEILKEKDGQYRVQVKGVDVFKPQTGEVVSSNTDGIACWFLDTDYNEESFFVRHAYFLGANDPYKSLKTTLKAEIDEEAWETLHSDTSRAFAKPRSGRIAVKVINHLGDEVMKVFRV